MHEWTLLVDSLRAERPYRFGFVIILFIAIVHISTIDFQFYFFGNRNVVLLKGNWLTTVVGFSYVSCLY